MITGKRIFESDGEAVSDMEVAVSVRWRHDDRIGGTSQKCVFLGTLPPYSVVGAIGVVIDGDGWDSGVEDAGSLPCGVDVSFILVGLVTRCEFHFGLSS